MRIAFVRLFYGRALVGEPRGSPGAYVTGLLTPPYARPPHLAVGRELTTHEEVASCAKPLLVLSNRSPKPQLNVIRCLHVPALPQLIFG